MTKYSILLVLLLCSFTAVAQHPVPYKTNNGNDVYGNFEKKQIEHLYELYSLKIDPSYELVNGREYLTYYFLSKSKPILYFGKKHSSSITLKGKKFVDVDLNYDTFADEVILIDSTRTFIYTPLEVALNKDYIDRFELYFVNDTLSFNYFSKNTNSDFDLQDGFYEVVYSRVSKYLIKHKSYTYESNGIKEYNYKPAGYVNIGNGFVKVKYTGQFIKLFGDRSAEVRKFIKKSGINIRKADKRQIIAVLRFCDSQTD